MDQKLHNPPGALSVSVSLPNGLDVDVRATNGTLGAAEVVARHVRGVFGANPPRVVHATHGNAIRTRYHGPRGKLGARIVATTAGGSKTWQYDHAFGLAGNHERAATALCERMATKSNALPWHAGQWFGSTLPDRSWVWVEIGGSL